MFLAVQFNAHSIIKPFAFFSACMERSFLCWREILLLIFPWTQLKRSLTVRCPKQVKEDCHLMEPWAHHFYLRWPNKGHRATFPFQSPQWGLASNAHWHGHVESLLLSFLPSSDWVSNASVGSQNHPDGWETPPSYRRLKAMRGISDSYLALHSVGNPRGVRLWPAFVFGIGISALLLSKIPPHLSLKNTADSQWPEAFGGMSELLKTQT